MVPRAMWSAMWACLIAVGVIGVSYWAGGFEFTVLFGLAIVVARSLMYQ